MKSSRQVLIGRKKKTHDELLKIYNELRDRQVTDFDINIKEE